MCQSSGVSRQHPAHCSSEMDGIYFTVARGRERVVYEKINLVWSLSWMIIFYAAMGGVSMFQTAGLCMFAAGLMQLSAGDWWVSSFKCKRKRLCEGRHDELPPAGSHRHAQPFLPSLFTLSPSLSLSLSRSRSLSLYLLSISISNSFSLLSCLAFSCILSYSLCGIGYILVSHYFI